MARRRSPSAARPSPSAARPRARVAAAAGETATASASVDWEALDAQMQDQTTIEILSQALDIFGDDLAIAFSGAEDVALIQYAHLTGKPFRVFSLDTGRLNPETYQLFDEVEKHFDIKIEFTFPDEKAVTDLVNEKGMFSFFEDGHKECCGVRKVQPLRRKLKTLKAWVTGQRKDQSPGTRMAVPAVQVDPVFEGLEGGPGSLVKFNPSPTPPARRCGTSSASWAPPSTSSTRWATSPSDARRAPARSSRDSRSARADGGGRTPP